MDETDFENLKAKLGNEFLDKTFLKVDDKNISINDFLADILLAGFSINSLNENEIDLLGREIAVLIDEFQIAGTHEIKFSCDDLPSGIYFYTIQTPEGSITKKMTLLK